MAIGDSKRKWRNAAGFVSSLAVVIGVKLSGCRDDRRCHAESRRSLCRCEWGTYQRGRGGGGRGEGFCDVGMVRVFFFLF